MSDTPFVREQTLLFFAKLRERTFHLGLDPEFSGVERLATAEQQRRLPALREHLDQFYTARGFEVIQTLAKQARAEGYGDVSELLEQVATFVNNLFQGQFRTYPTYEEPSQRDLLKVMLRMVETGESNGLNEFINKHLFDMDGHFFVEVSETLRYARQSRNVPVSDVIELIARMVCWNRIHHQLPCSFAALYKS